MNLCIPFEHVARSSLLENSTRSFVVDVNGHVSRLLTPSIRCFCCFRGDLAVAGAVAVTVDVLAGWFLCPLDGENTPTVLVYSLPAAYCSSVCRFVSSSETIMKCTVNIWFFFGQKMVDWTKFILYYTCTVHVENTKLNGLVCLYINEKKRNDKWWFPFLDWMFNT